MKHELTVTLRPLLYSKTPQQQFDITSQYMKTVLFPYKASIIAELTQEHNVHYHCLVEVDGTLDRSKLLNRFRQYHKYLGRKSLAAVQFEESYEKYMLKSYNETVKILPDPFVKDDFKLSNLLNKDIKLIKIFNASMAAERANTSHLNINEPGHPLSPRPKGVRTVPTNDLDYGIDFTDQSVKI